MRTTIEFDDDTARAVENLRREEHIGVSEAVNTLIRRSLLPREPREPFRQETRAIGLKIDVSNVADALEAIEGPSSR